MHHMLMRAEEEQDLFWLTMGFVSSEGEKDEDFNSEQESQSAKEDSFDSDFGKDEEEKQTKKKVASKGKKATKKSKHAEGIIKAEEVAAEEKQTIAE